MCLVISPGGLARFTFSLQGPAWDPAPSLLLGDGQCPLHPSLLPTGTVAGQQGIAVEAGGAGLAAGPGGVAQAAAAGARQGVAVAEQQVGVTIATAVAGLA